MNTNTTTKSFLRLTRNLPFQTNPPIPIPTLHHIIPCSECGIKIITMRKEEEEKKALKGPGIKIVRSEWPPAYPLTLQTKPLGKEKYSSWVIERVRKKRTPRTPVTCDGPRPYSFKHAHAALQACSQPHRWRRSCLGGFHLTYRPSGGQTPFVSIPSCPPSHGLFSDRRCQS